MKLYNTATSELEEFQASPIVNIYTCGVTPYDSTHIGHAAVFITFDVLQRRLRSLGHETRLVRNVTDIDDDILRKSNELGVYYRDLVDSEVKKFNKDMRSLNILESWSEPLATSAMKEIIEFSEQALESNHAYEVEGTVFFSVKSWPKFGELSGYDRETMLKFAAERGGFPDDDRKKDPLDFVLWQAAVEGEPSWDSPWGKGRPGWHIECSALASKEFGEQIDIHGGGSDLIFPHHECELAQSEAINQKPFVKLWMHQAMVRMDGEKMSKSLGNMSFVSELVKTYDPRTIRLAITKNHYRTEWEWADDQLAEADEQLQRWISNKNNRVDPNLFSSVGEALDNDLDTPVAASLIVEASNSGFDVTRAADLIGIIL